MCVCMYVCMHVCMFTCIHVRMYVWTHAYTHTAHTILDVAVLVWWGRGGSTICFFPSANLDERSEHPLLQLLTVCACVKDSVRARERLSPNDRSTDIFKYVKINSGRPLLTRVYIFPRICTNENAWTFSYSNIHV